MPAPELHILKRRYADQILEVPGVEAIGVTNTTVLIELSQASAEKKVEEIVPESFHDYLEYEYSGQIISEDGTVNPMDRNSNHRPIPGGVACSAQNSGTTGTTYLPLFDDDDNAYMASNNHVIAHTNQAEVGDRVYQSSRTRGGAPVGRLAGYIPLKSGASVDIAWARLNEGTYVTDEIHNFDYPDEAATVSLPAVGDTVAKSGVTTGVSAAEVRSIDSSVNVNFSNGEVWRIDNCIITSNMSSPGDSGAPVLGQDNTIVGALFAGSDTITVVSAAGQIEAETGLTHKYGPQEEPEPEPTDEEQRIEELETGNADLRSELEGLETLLEAIETDIEDLEDHHDTAQSITERIRARLT